MITDYYELKEEHRKRLMRMYKRRLAGKITKEQFYAGVDKMIRQENTLAARDQYGTGFLADLATDSLRSSGLTEADDLWPWIASTFRIYWSDWYGNKRLKNAVGLACIRVFKSGDDNG